MRQMLQIINLLIHTYALYTSFIWEQTISDHMDDFKIKIKNTWF